MRSIKHVLTERFYLWEDAVKLAETDPEVDLTGTGQPFTPSTYLEGEEGEEVVEGTSEGQAAEGQAVEGQAAETAQETTERKAEEPAAADPVAIPAASKPPAETPRL